MVTQAPTPSEIRNVLENYGIDTSTQFQFQGDVTQGSTTVTNLLFNTETIADIKVGALLVSSDIPENSFVVSVDASNNSLEMSLPATQDNPTINIDHVFNSVVSDGWIIEHRDSFVIPWMETKTRQTFYRTEQIEEIVNGNGTTTLFVSRRPIISVEQIRYLVRETYYGSVDVTMIEVIGSEGIIRSLETTSIETTAVPIFPKGKRNIAVTYTYGYTDLPSLLHTAVKYFVAEGILGQIADRTGGGNLSTQGWNRNWGERGKYTNIRNDFARKGLAAMQNYMTGVVG